MRRGDDDPLSVRTEELARVIDWWFSIQGDHGEEESMDWLSERTELNPRAIRRVRYRETKFTTLWLADKLLTAVGRPDVLDNGIPIVPNPRWNQERWQEWYMTRCSYD